MNYNEKMAIANAYLEKNAGVTWDDLSDINSLHDVEEQEDIFAMCDDRLREDGFDFVLDTIDPEEDDEDDSDVFIDNDYL